MNITVQLQGGLGNQLFQYATARAAAHKRRCSVLLDQSWFTKAHKDVTPREFLLSKLQIKGILTSPDLTMRKPKWLRKIFQRVWPTSTYFYSEKFHYKFDSQLERSPTFATQNLYLMGYWQSYRYFEAIREILQAEITPKTPLDAHYQNYLKQIQASSSAMVHIRRGDYVHLASASKVHGFIGLNYYRQGMAALLNKAPDIHFYVFSDDLLWASENLPYQDRITYVQSHESSDAVVQELELMTYCQHHLIANSSLSWWAAWLGKNPNSIVICPSHWTNDLTMNWDDLLPAHWIRI
jgi:hypothetical protein